MGPSPSGFSEKMVHTKHLSPGTVFTQNLRVFAKAVDFSKVNQGSDVYIINFITLNKLDTRRKSVDWNWIICGQKKQMQLAVITRFAKTSLIPMILTILLLPIGRIRW